MEWLPFRLMCNEVLLRKPIMIDISNRRSTPGTSHMSFPALIRRARRDKATISIHFEEDFGQRGVDGG